MVRWVRQQNCHACTFPDMAPNNLVQTNVRALACSRLSVKSQPLTDRLRSKTNVLDDSIDRERVDSGLGWEIDAVRQITSAIQLPTTHFSESALKQAVHRKLRLSH